MKQVIWLALVLILAPVAVVAQTTGCWDFADYSEVTISHSGPGNASVMVLPDGSGDMLTAARGGDGGVVDATISLTLNDCLGIPIANFPFEDLWLESLDGGLVQCLGGSGADHNTDPNGQTVWTLPLRAGGSSAAGCLVMISGQALTISPLPLAWNSPDLNGDLSVNLTDVTFFVGDFWGSYAYRSDFRRDGVINLSDVALMVSGMGKSCP